MRSTKWTVAAGIGLAWLSAVNGAWAWGDGGVGGGDDPFADEVVSYEAGAGAGAYTDSATALGSPERMSGELFGFPGVVSPFSGPWVTDEIVSIGSGGWLVVKFNTPVTDDADNPYGIDLLIFGNAFFNSFPTNVVEGALVEGGVIELSADGETWHTVPDVTADNLFPTMGYNDGGAFDEQPGRVETDFTRPVDPSLALDHFMGLTYEEVRELYRGSGGGVGVDLADVGLAEITHVRISHAGGTRTVPEIDAFADVSPRIPGDVNYDGVVGIGDLLAVIGAWGATVPGGVPADFNNDGVVGIADLLTVIGSWG